MHIHARTYVRTYVRLHARTHARTHAYYIHMLDARSKQFSAKMLSHFVSIHEYLGIHSGGYTIT